MFTSKMRRSIICERNLVALKGKDRVLLIKSLIDMRVLKRRVLLGVL
jgi:hypothetical protein